MAARVLTDEDLEPLRREIAELRAQIASYALGDVLSTEQAAAIARVKPKTVRVWVESGDLPAEKKRRRLRIRRADLEAYLAGTTPKAAGLLSSLTPRND
jgi:excisionase family DNA binding protein